MFTPWNAEHIPLGHDQFFNHFLNHGEAENLPKTASQKNGG
jgi:hypothetical protein